MLFRSGTVSDCYNTGSVYASFNAGGICGNGTNATNCYNIGDIASYNGIGAISGGNGDGATFLNTYWNLDSVQKAGSVARENAEKLGVGTGADSTTPLSDSEMKDAANFAGFDFDGVWGVSPEKNGGYPYLKGPTAALSVRGDVNADGTINMLDVALLFQHIRGVVVLPEECLDVNQDDAVNILDVTALYQHVLRKINILN